MPKRKDGWNTVCPSQGCGPVGERRTQDSRVKILWQGCTWGLWEIWAGSWSLRSRCFVFFPKMVKIYFFPNKENGKKGALKFYSVKFLPGVSSLIVSLWVESRGRNRLSVLTDFYGLFFFVLPEITLFMFNAFILSGYSKQQNKTSFWGRIVPNWPDWRSAGLPLLVVFAWSSSNSSLDRRVGLKAKFLLVRTYGGRRTMQTILDGREWVSFEQSFQGKLGIYLSTSWEKGCTYLMMGVLIFCVSV